VHREGKARVLSSEGRRERKGTETGEMVSESTRGRNLFLFQTSTLSNSRSQKGKSS
jgi:hypothetical protein